MNEKQGIYASPSSFSSPKMHISTHFHCYGPSYTYKDYFKQDRKSTRLNSSHDQISYAVFCLKKKKNKHRIQPPRTLPGGPSTAYGVTHTSRPCMNVTKSSEHPPPPLPTRRLIIPGRPSDAQC